VAASRTSSMFRAVALLCNNNKINLCTAMSCSQAMPPTLWQSARLIMITCHCSTIEKQKLQQKQQQSTGSEKKSTTINPLHCNRHWVVFAFSPCCQDLVLLKHWLTACNDIVADVDCFFPSEQCCGCHCCTCIFLAVQ